MLNLHANHHHAVEPFVYFLLQCFVLMGVVAVSQQSCGGKLLVSILNDADMSECDDTAEIGGVLLALHIVLVDNAE